jgi:hypothetical protein
MEFLLIGLAVAANIIFILFKYERKRYPDATLDFFLLIVVTIIFSGSYGALVVGTIASLVISIYLYANPPNLPKLPESTINIDLDDLKQRFSRRY